jgi:small subunit ribosomal protein S16
MCSWQVIIEGFAAYRWPGGYVVCLRRCKELSTQSIPDFLLSWAQFSKEFIMVVIRLSRGGSKGRPFFNIVVADKRERRDGRFIERLGFHNPSAAATEEGTRINTERLTYWRGVGAQVSPTVERLVKQTAAKAATTA